MKSIKRTLLGLLLLAAGVTVSPAAVIDGNTRVQVSFLETSDGTWAFIRLTSRYGITISGDVTVSKNGELLKMEPVTTSDQALVTAYLGPNGKSYTVCADYEGIMALGGDNYRPFAVKSCGIRSPLRPITRLAPADGQHISLRGMPLDGLTIGDR